ncbi:hypothetical protein [Streptomyces sp. Z26]|uniref:hypothetical protein n=1 Tax=Streptomyces sp. Z26 TaxID=2500177 RepID=UPI001F0C9346|nr:hypothetical protein [Streptomyces sp. Z26]
MKLVPPRAVRRPTEDAAIHAADATPRSLPSVDQLLDALTLAAHRHDLAGVRLCTHLVARAAGHVSW